MSDLLDDAIQVREKCLALIEEAEEILSVGVSSQVEIHFTNKYKINLGSEEVVGLGKRTSRKWVFFGKRTTTLYFLFRKNYYSDRYDTIYWYSTMLWYSKTKLIQYLEQNGYWGRFLADNENIANLIREAVIDGKKPERGNSGVTYR